MIAAIRDSPIAWFAPQHPSRLLCRLRYGNRFPVILAISIVFAYVCTSDATGFAIRGGLECKFFRASGELFKAQDLSFEAAVIGNKWQITNFEGQTKRWIRGCDGSSIYHVFVQNSKPTEAAIVELGPMPSGGYPVAVVWLAFASAEYLGNSSELFAPWSDPFGEPSVTACNLEIARSGETPFLPTSIKFLVDQQRIVDYPRTRYFVRERASGAMQAQAKERAAFDSAGFLAGRYRVVSFTNFNGHTIPLEFALEKYRQVGQPGHTNSPVAATYRGRVNQCWSVSDIDGLPDISRKPVSVSDLRFRDKTQPLDSIHYWITNHWITSADDPGLLKIKQTKLESLASLNGHDSKRFVVLTMLATSVAVPLLFAAKKTWKRPQEHIGLMRNASPADRASGLAVEHQRGQK